METRTVSATILQPYSENIASIENFLLWRMPFRFLLVFLFFGIIFMHIGTSSYSIFTLCFSFASLYFFFLSFPNNTIWSLIGFLLGSSKHFVSEEPHQSWLFRSMVSLLSFMLLECRRNAETVILERKRNITKFTFHACFTLVLFALIGNAISGFFLIFISGQIVSRI